MKKSTDEKVAVQPSQLNIAEVSSGFHQADWSTTLGIIYCYPISFLFFVYLFTCLSRNLILTKDSDSDADADVSSI